MRALNIKIAKEIENSGRLRELAKKDEMGFDKTMRLYGQAKEVNKKIEFLQHLKQALENQEGKDENKIR